MKIIREFRDFNRLVESKEDCSFLNGSSIDGDFHQAIMDVGYNWWVDKSDDVNSYDQMIFKMEKEFGYKFALLLLLGKYNQQVGNGGHVQYFDNAYASINNDDIELHKQMIEWFRKAGLDKTDLGRNIFEIMEDSGDVFEEMVGDNKQCDNCGGSSEVEDECPECNGNGTIMDNCPECDGEGEIDGEVCPECGGSGEIEIECPECGGEGKVYTNCEYCGGSGDNKNENCEQLENFDNKYYSIDGWEDYLNKFSKDVIIEKYPNFEKELALRKQVKKYNL